MERLSKNDYFLEIAKVVAKRSTCLRRQYGAVVVKDDQIISTGYNGSACGELNCCDTGLCVREQLGVPHGERYELCIAVHAECNALIQAGRDANGAILYLAGFENGKEIDNPEPCLLCSRIIKNAHIASVITKEHISEVSCMHQMKVYKLDIEINIYNKSVSEVNQRPQRHV